MKIRRLIMQFVNFSVHYLNVGNAEIGKQIGNQIFDKLLKLREDANIKTALLHNTELAAEGKMLF